MKSKMFIGVVLIGFLFLFSSCEKDDIMSPINSDLPGITNDAIATDRAPVVPFTGSYVTYPRTFDIPGGVENCTILYPDAGAIFYIPSEGTATHLGNSQWIAFSSIVPIGDREYHDVNGAPGFTQVYYQNGCQTFVAANGATLEGKFCGQSTITYLILGPDAFLPISGFGSTDYVIEEGTGNLDGSTGYGIAEFTVNFDFEEEMLIGQVNFDGVLNKNKKGVTVYPYVDCREAE